MNKQLLMKGALLAAVALIEISHAQIIYSNSFDSPQTIVSATNGNSNYIGTGPGAPEADLEYGEWMEGRRSNRVQLSNDEANGRLLFDFKSQGRTVWHLIDLSAVNSSLNGETATLSFVVEDFVNGIGQNLVVSVWEGSGLSFSGVTDPEDGYLLVRSDSFTPNINRSSNPNTSGLVLNPGAGEVPFAGGVIQGDGEFRLDFPLSSAGQAGGYLLLGIAGDVVNPGAQFAMDQLQVGVENLGGASYAAWQSANNTSGGLEDDHDGDGVRNGVEYFVGGGSNTTGFTASPGQVQAGDSLMIVFNRSAEYPGTYAQDFVIETYDAETGLWSPETSAVTVSESGVSLEVPTPSPMRMLARLRILNP
ncbi:MAG: hypothetical protein ACPGJR_07495 [Akkermansiaceae bacterium]